MKMPPFFSVSLTYTRSAGFSSESLAFHAYNDMDELNVAEVISTRLEEIGKYKPINSITSLFTHEDVGDLSYRVIEAQVLEQYTTTLFVLLAHGKPFSSVISLLTIVPLKSFRRFSIQGRLQYRPFLCIMKTFQ